MNGYPVLKGASYTLAITPDMVIHNGTTQTTEMIVNPESEYLKELPNHLRSFEDAVSYIPNQVYIGNAKPADLAATEFPFYDKKWENASRDGKYGQIMPEDEFYGLIQICDVFELVMLEKSFAASVKEKLAAQNLLKEDQLAALDKNSENDDAKIASLVNDEHAEPLYFEHKLVGAVKRAHDVDVNLSAHVMLENLVTKASNVLSLIELVKKAGVNPDEVDYVIDCCEEACGDMNQRGGGNFAKAAAEIAGYTNATGSDVRGFCAGPAHAMLHAAVLVSADDGVSPQIRTDIIGRHTIGTGSAPQNVIGSLVADPLERAGLLMTDIDKYSPEMQNPDITKPAGAGDVPEANYKMIAALAVKKGQIARTDIANFVKEHGMTGWAPTQGHIPSGVPYIGPLREEVLAGETKRAMIIGKGSLFLGRMTNLFDGVSFVVQANDGSAANGGEAGFDEAKVKAMIGQAMREFANGLLGSEE